MSLLEIINVSKSYGKYDATRKVLNNVTIAFPSSGLVSIVGKSGCGKTTLLSLISLLEKPDSGQIMFNGVNVLKFTKKQVAEYRQQHLGIIFQNYHLIEDETALYNVMLPMLILGKKYEEAENDAKVLFDKINFPDWLRKKRVCDLSGGEKQRVGILRGMINAPRIIIADEPTGALDSKNASYVMELLKKISEKRLVILVSHNKKLVEKYSDRIISIKDGRIENDVVIKKEDNGVPIVKVPKFKKSKAWIDRLAINRIKRNGKINILLILSLVTGLVSTNIVVGFANGSENSVHNQIFEHYDYETCTLTKELFVDQSGNGLKIVKTLRPSLDEMENISYLIKNYRIETNYDSVLSKNPVVNFNGNVYEDFSFIPVYSFIQKQNYKGKVLAGSLPIKDDLFHCVINKKGYEKLKNNGFSIGSKITIKSNNAFYIYQNDTRLTSCFDFEEQFIADCVVNEMDFLASPTIYYSFIAFDEYMAQVQLENQRSIKDTINEASSNDPITSFCWNLFLNVETGLDISFTKLPKPYSLTSNNIDKSNALEGLISACSIGMTVFLIIACAGTCLILGIISFYMYSSDRKQSAILTCLGSNTDDITSIYISCSLLITIISALLAALLSCLLELIFNRIVYSTTGLKSLIKIPWINWYGYNSLYPLIIFITAVVFITTSTIVPIKFSKKISVREELAEE